MPDFLDIHIAREFGLSPAQVRAWPSRDVERVLMVLAAEGRARERRERQR